MDLDPKSLVGKTYRYRGNARWRGEFRVLGVGYAGNLEVRFLTEMTCSTSEARMEAGEVNDNWMRPSDLPAQLASGSLVEVPSPPTERLCDCGRPARAGDEFTPEKQYHPESVCDCAMPLCNVCWASDSTMVVKRHNAKHHPRVEPLPDPRNPKVGDRYRLKTTWGDTGKFLAGGVFEIRGVGEHLTCDAAILETGHRFVVTGRDSMADHWWANCEPLPGEPPKPVGPALTLQHVTTAGDPAPLLHPLQDCGAPAPPAQSGCSCLNDDPGHLDPTCPLFVPPSVKPEAVCACLGMECATCGPVLRREADKAMEGKQPYLPTLFPEVSPKPVHHYSPQGLVGGRWSW